MMEIILGRSAFLTGIFLRSHGLGSLSNSSTVRCLCLCDPRRWNIVKRESASQNRSLPTNFFYSQSKVLNILERRNASLRESEESLRTFASQASQNDQVKDAPLAESTKKNIFQKMKQLTRDYWHILIPVHLATSSVWVAIFYTAAKNGVDIVSIMEYLHMPEKYIDMIQNSKAGDLAVTYALYKIFTPLRYTVTVGGTTMAIRYLDRMGYLKFGQPGAASTVTSMFSRKQKANEGRPNYSEPNSEEKNK